MLLLIRLADRLRRVYWRLLHPTTLGARCIVLTEDRVVLVRHAYDQWWHLPGGGVKKFESFGDAARREVSEETGLAVREMELFGLYLNTAEGKSDHVAVFVAADAVGELSPGLPEVTAVECFPLRALPERASPFTRRRLAEYLSGMRSERF